MSGMMSWPGSGGAGRRATFQAVVLMNSKTMHGILALRLRTWQPQLRASERSGHQVEQPDDPGGAGQVDEHLHLLLDLPLLDRLEHLDHAPAPGDAPRLLGRGLLLVVALVDSLEHLAVLAAPELAGDPVVIHRAGGPGRTSPARAGAPVLEHQLVVVIVLLAQILARVGVYTADLRHFAAGLCRWLTTVGQRTRLASLPSETVLQPHHDQA